MAWLQNTVTRRFNVRHRAWGRVFGDRYKAVLVEGGEGHYYQTLMDYIHLNPVRAKLIRPGKGKSVLDFPWSSVAGGYALPPTKRAKWLAAEHGLKSFGCEDTTVGRRRFVERLDKRAVEESAKSCGVPLMPEEVDARVSHLRRGWYWGTQAFAEQALKVVEKQLHKNKSRGYASAAQRKAHGEAEAEKMLADGLQAAGMSQTDLAKTKGADARKAIIAKILWNKTTVSQGWIAEHLHMKSAANVGMVARRELTTKKLAAVPKALREWAARTPSAGPG
jgi:hypothetical protein